MQRIINEYKNRLTLISFLIIVFAFIADGYMKDILLMVATAVAGAPVAYQAWQALRLKAFSIELLVTIAVIGALIIGEYVESAVVTFLFLFGAYLEGRTLEKTRKSLKELTELAPQEAIVFRNEEKITLPVDEVIVGDRIILQSGSKIPVDGKIVNGEATINEAPITGESKRVIKTVNARVFSGTIVDNGYMEMIAEKVGDDTTFAKMIELVEEAQESKTKTEKFLNKFASIYTPVIVLMSIVVYFLTKDVHIAITFLVIACPGALVIGAPVSSVAGIGNGAKHGVLIKGGEVFDTFSKVDTVVFDKTGTLTKGKPSVTDVRLFVNEDENRLFREVALVETISEHHLGKAIVEEANKRNLSLDETVTEGKVIKGNGIEATVLGKRILIGNRKLMEANDIKLTSEMLAYAEEREKKGNTAIFVARNREAMMVISIADEIREDAKKAIRALRRYGIKQIIMLTGDNKHTAKAVASELRLDRFHAELLPEDKVKYVKKLKETGHVVAMAGDGINDAPAIATADIGIAMGEGGTDISMETADVVLMADQLTQFAHAYRLSKATIRNMWQNTIFAIATVFILLIGVLYGKIHLASGMFIHEASVLFVILNGMRLINFNRKRKTNRKLVEQIA